MLLLDCSRKVVRSNITLPTKYDQSFPLQISDHSMADLVYCFNLFSHCFMLSSCLLIILVHFFVKHFLLRLRSGVNSVLAIF